MDQTIADGVDVISISFGNTGLPMHYDLIAKYSFAAMKKGIFVSCAGGNDGPGFGTSNGFPRVTLWTFGLLEFWFLEMC